MLLELTTGARSLTCLLKSSSLANVVFVSTSLPFESNQLFMFSLFISSLSCDSAALSHIQLEILFSLACHQLSRLPLSTDNFTRMREATGDVSALNFSPRDKFHLELVGYCGESAGPAGVFHSTAPSRRVANSTVCHVVACPGRPPLPHATRPRAARRVECHPVHSRSQSLFSSCPWWNVIYSLPAFDFVRLSFPPRVSASFLGRAGKWQSALLPLIALITSARGGSECRERRLPVAGIVQPTIFMDFLSR